MDPSTGLVLAGTESSQLPFLEIAGLMVALAAYVLSLVMWTAHVVLAKLVARASTWTFYAAWTFTLVGELALVTALVARGMQPAVPRLPLTTLFEITALVQLGAAGSLLVIMPRAKDLRAAAPVVMAVVVGLWAYGYSKHQPITSDLVPALKSVWLQIHVATAVLSYGPLFMSGVTSIMAVIMFWSGGRFTEERPSEEEGGEPQPSIADRYEEWTYRIIAFGFPWLTALIITGAIWANYAWGRAWGWDVKEMWSAITWLIYVAYLHMRLRAGWRGLPASLVASAALLAMVVTYVGITWVVRVAGVQSLHDYGG